jgi:hypothetical protein
MRQGTWKKLCNLNGHQKIAKRSPQYLDNQAIRNAIVLRRIYVQIVRRVIWRKAL